MLQTRISLRSCGIHIEISADLPAERERVLELINRTNQLNYTKTTADGGRVHGPNDRAGPRLRLHSGVRSLRRLRSMRLLLGARTESSPISCLAAGSCTWGSRTGYTSTSVRLRSPSSAKSPRPLKPEASGRPGSAPPRRDTAATQRRIARSGSASEARVLLKGGCDLISGR